MVNTFSGLFNGIVNGIFRLFVSSTTQLINDFEDVTLTDDERAFAVGIDVSKFVKEFFSFSVPDYQYMDF